MYSRMTIREMAQSTLLCFVCIVAYIGFCHAEDIAPGISKYLYCDGCISTVKELKKMTDRSSLDSRDVIVSEALEKICKPYNFVAYEYSPPKTVKACKLLMERHEDDIEVSFVKKFNEDLEHEICYKISKACIDVDRSKKPDAADIDLTTNGKTEKVQKEIVMDPQSGAPISKKEVKEKKKDEARTLSKKDKKAKKSKKVEKSQPKKKAAEQKGAAEIFQVDVNDPESINKVLSQIKQATENHKKDFYEKQQSASKDEL